jgi:hypothetical protein
MFGAGYVQEAFQVYRMFRERGAAPNVYHLTTLISALADEAKPEAAKAVRQSSFSPPPPHLYVTLYRVEQSPAS